jgi:DNA-binding GntR family transcriptional regulator
LYLKVARKLEGQIQQGAFAIGDQIPSVRQLSQQHRVSVSTVLQAYFWLEGKGWIEAKPKSGFYVRGASESA